MYSLEYGTWTDELKDAFKHNVTRAQIFYDEGEINENNGLKDLTIDEQRYISNYGFVGTATAKKLELNLISKLYSRNIFNNYLPPSFKNSGVIEWGTSTGKRLTMEASGTWKSCIYVVKNLTNYVGKTIRLKTDFVKSGTNTPRYTIGLCDADGNNREQKGWSEITGATISFVVPELDGTKNYLYVGLAANTISATTEVGDYAEYNNIVLTIDNENMEYQPYINPNINLENKELDLKIGADYNGETYYIYYGKYIVDKPPEIDETTGTIRVVAYDYMIKFNKPYVDRVTYPCTLSNLLEDVCNQAGVILGGYSGAYAIPNGNFIVENNQFEGYTLRQVLQEIAKCTFSWAYIGQDNHLYLDFYKDGDITETITIDDYKANAFKKANEYYGPVNQVTYADSNIQGQEARVKDQQSIDENGLKELVIYDNLFAYTPEKRAELIQEGTRLLGLRYMPISQLELIGLAYLDCRDIIEVETLDNETFTSRVFSHQIRYNGTLHDSIVTEGTSDVEEAYKNTANSIFQNQQTRIIVDKANKRIESVVEDVQETLEDYPTIVEMNSAITQKANEITSSVSETYSTKTETANAINSIDVGGRNYLLETNQGQKRWYFNLGNKYKKPTFEDINWLGQNALQFTTQELNETYTTDWKVLQYNEYTLKRKLEPNTEYIVCFDCNYKHYHISIAEGNSTNNLIQNYTSDITDCVDIDGDTYYHMEFKFTTKPILNITSQILRIEALGEYLDNPGTTVKIANLKLEKGNKATEWSPAPEDIQNELHDNYSTTIQMNSAITQKANEITSEVSQTYTTKTETIEAIKNIDIGGRNYALGTGTANVHANQNKNNDSYKLYDLSLTVEELNQVASGKLICSFDMELSDDMTGSSGTPYIAVGQYNSPWVRVDVTETQVGKYHKEIVLRNRTWSDNKLGVRADYLDANTTLTISNLKVEIGDTYTGWTPAPEDYSTTTEMQSAIDQKADSITSTVSATYTTKTEFNNLEIGGRNYFEGTSNEWKDLLLTNAQNEVLYLSNETDLKPKGLKPGDVLRISFYIKYQNVSSTATNPHVYLLGTRNYGGTWASINIDGGSMEARLKEIMNSSSKEGYVQTYITLPSNFNNGTYTERWYLGVRFDYYSGTVYAKNLMVAKGDKYLDWLPAPEDYSTTVEMNSTISQTAAGINTEVAKKVGKNEIISTINQSAESVTINANKVNLNGYVTATNLQTAGSTTINGSNITTGTIKSSNYVANTSGTSINLSNGVIDTKGFKVNSTGRVTATSGAIGGFELDSNNGFIANVTLPYTYTQTDIDRIRNILEGNITPTQADYDKYDFTQSGVLTSADYLICVQIVNNRRSGNGTFTIDSKNSKKCIQFTDNIMGLTSSIGLFGASFSRIHCDSNIYSEGGIFVGDNREAVIQPTNENGGEIFLRDSNGNEVISLNTDSNSPGKITCASLNQRLINGTGNNYNVLSVGENISIFNFKRGNHSINGRVDDTNNTNNVYLSVTDGTSTSNIFPTQIDTPLLIQTSKESVKKNIEKYLGNASSIVRDSEIYTYNFKSEEDGSKKHIGFIIGDQGGDYKTPEEVISNGEGIDTYTMTSILWKAVQEQQKIIQEQQKIVEQIQKEINELKEERK